MPAFVFQQMESIQDTPVFNLDKLPDQPVLMELESHPNQKWVAIFTEEKDLHETMKICKIIDYKVKIITNGKEFVESILDAGKNLRIMLNPRLVPGNKTRWTEVVLG